MARLSRITQLIFAGSASNNGQFGSAQAGTFNLTNNVATIQALSAWANGWDDAVISGERLPCLEEMQGVDYVVTSQLAYLFQQGIAEYDVATTYYIQSMVMRPSTYELYGSVTDNNTGNTITNATYWTKLLDFANSAGTLTGTTLKSTVTASSLVSFGTSPQFTGTPALTGNTAGALQYSVANAATGASVRAGFTASTGTANAFIDFDVRDNTGVPTVQLSGGAAITGFTIGFPVSVTGGNLSVSRSVAAGTLQVFVNNTGASGANFAIFQLQTVTSNSTLNLLLGDNTGSPYGQIVAGSAISALTYIQAKTTDTTFAIRNTSTGASVTAGLQLSTGTANSTATLILRDVSSVPVLQLSMGSAVGSFALPNPTTATTQTAGDNSTKLATTAYADRKICVGRVSTQTGAVATGTTVIPLDDTIPQSGEGDQYMSLAITPQNAANILVIDVTINIASSAASGSLIAALFQDATANSLAVASIHLDANNFVYTINFKHVMTAGTTSSTTFKTRAGCSAAGTTTFNGASGARLFGGVIASSMVITEYTA